MGAWAAALDADFILKIANIQSPEIDRSDLFLRLMEGLDCTPMVHPYVFDHELHACNLAHQMEQSGKLQRIEYGQFISPSAGGRQLYEETFRGMYHVLTLEDYGEEREPDTDIFASHAKKSYGEVHSLIMAAQLKIPVFYSNDHSARTLCKRFSAGQIRAITMEMACEQLHKKDICPITPKERKCLLRK